MTDLQSTPSEPEPFDAEVPGVARARRVGRDLAWMAPLVIVGFLAMGAFSVIDLVYTLAFDSSMTSAQALPMKVSAVFNVLYYGLIGVLVAQVFRAGSAALEVLAGRAEEAREADGRLREALGRLARPVAPLEPSPQASAPPPSPPPTPADPLEEVRLAIEKAQWNEAKALARRYLDEHPDDPEGTRLAGDLDAARADAARTVRARAEAARIANDPGRVLELRDELTVLIEGDELRTFDQETARWFMALIQKRLRAGKVLLDVAELASKVAERFDQTVEGASLRAALPTLRRSAGLCARCGQPYTGIADACPACLGSASFPAFGATETEDDPEAEPDAPSEPPVPEAD
jgi:hypothetical protein